MQKHMEGTTITVPVPLHDPVKRDVVEHNRAIRTREEPLRDRLICDRST